MLQKFFCSQIKNLQSEEDRGTLLALLVIINGEEDLAK